MRAIEKMSISVNSTMRKAVTMNGTKGRAAPIIFFFCRKRVRTPIIAPNHTETRRTASPCSIPKNAPTPKNSMTSPNPRALPFVRNQTRRKGSATTIGPRRTAKLPSFAYLRPNMTRDRKEKKKRKAGGTYECL